MLLAILKMGRGERNLATLAFLGKMSGRFLRIASFPARAPDRCFRQLPWMHSKNLSGGSVGELHTNGGVLEA